MPPVHTVECASGHSFETTIPGGVFSVPCIQCPDPPLQAEIVWSASSRHDAAVHPAERTVVWQHPVTGHVEYTPRNDVPIPERYARWGYERREFTSLRDLGKFERQHDVVNERAHYDKGSGRSYDGADSG